MSHTEPSPVPVILVVEDEPLILLNAVDMIEEAGMKAVEAVNAAAAMRILEARADIALVFTDIDMPGQMDGLGLADAVQRRWPDVRIILTSGHMRPNDVDLPVGSSFFPKPYAPRDVLGRISALLA